MKMSLVMVTQEGAAKELPVSGLPLMIGRGPDCKLRIPLDSVSRQHCELLENDDEELVVRDLKSSNGTFVNRERIKTRELVPGDLLAVGPVVFVVRIDGHPKQVDPVSAFQAGAVNRDGSPVAARPGAATKDDSAVRAAPVAKVTAPKPSNDLDSLVADLSESDFDIDFGDDDEPKKS